MANLFQQYGIGQTSPPPAAGAGRNLFREFGVAKPASAAGVSGVQDAASNILSGFNRGLGTIAGAADYALLGFLDNTKEGQARRPLGYLTQVLRGEQAVPFTDDERFAYEAVTPGQKILQRGGEVVGESVGPVGAVGAFGRAALAPAANTAQAVAQFLVNSQAARPATATAGEAVTVLTSGMGEETGRLAAPDSTLAPMAGGIAGGLAPWAASMPLARKAAGKVYSTVRDALSPDVQAARARTTVREQLGPQLEGESAQAGLRRGEELATAIPGFQPDLAQRTRSTALKATKDDITAGASGEDLDALRAREQGNIEAVRAYARQQAPAGDPTAEATFEPLIQERRAAAEQARALEQQRAAAIDAARERQAQLVEQRTGVRADTAAKAYELRAQAAALPRTSDIVARERQALQELQERTAGARGEVAGRLTRIDRGQAGETIREGIRAERSRRVDALNAEAEQLGLEGLRLTTPFRSFAGSVKAWQRDLLPSQEANLPGVLKDIDVLRNRPSVTFRDVKALRESLVDDVLEATRDTSPGNRKRLANSLRLRQMLDEQVLGADVLEGWQRPEGLDRAAHYVNRPDFANSLSAARAGTAKRKPFETLADFLVAKGGIRESRGELSARDIGYKTRPGLFRKQGKGMTHEDAALAAWEAGYFPGRTERPDPDDLLRALEDDLAGRTRRREVDMDDAARMAEQKSADEDMTAALDDLGIDWQKTSADEIKARVGELAQDPVDLSEAADRWRAFRRRYFQEVIEPFERGAVLKATRRDGTGFYRTLDEDVAFDFLDSADAARQIRGIAQNQPEMLRTVQDVALDDLASKAVVNGVISPRALERWAEQRRGALGELPDVQRAVGEVVTAVADVEGRFRQGRRIIADRLAGERQQIQGRRDELSEEVRRTVRGGAAETERLTSLGQEARAIAVKRDQELQAAMQPLLQRMGTLNERKMALEDTILARRLTSIERGSQEPGNVIDQAVKNPALMDRLLSSVKPHPDARAALRRHVWDGLASMDGQALGSYMADNEQALTMVLGKEHMRRIGQIRDALQMLEFAPAATKAQPIRAALLSRFRRATGMNPSAMMGSFLGIQRGRSSRAVETFASGFRWIAERNDQAMEKVMREALFNPAVAEDLVNSFSLGRRGGEPTRKLRAWLWRLGLVAPAQQEAADAED